MPTRKRWASGMFCMAWACQLASCGESAPPEKSDASAADASWASDAKFDDASGEGSIDAPLEAAEAAEEPPPQPYARPDYVHLAETGLFASADPRETATDVVLFEPTYKLWSDSAVKRRWVHLPRGTQIDTSDMDHWIFPVGTKLWKEFSLDGVRLETRLVERYGTGPEDYWMGAFVWNQDQSDAVLAPDGANDILETAHDAPAQKACGACHRGDRGRVLGLSAIQMSRDDRGPTLQDFAERGLLSNPPPAGERYRLPGDDVTAAALGYLHANCGHCHNENGTSWPDTQMVLRSVVADRDVSSSAVMASIIGGRIQYWRGGAVTLRVTPGEPEESGIFVRMQARGSKDQMPPLATEFVDHDGLELVRSWIAALPKSAPP